MGVVSGLTTLLRRDWAVSPFWLKYNLLDSSVKDSFVISSLNSDESEHAKTCLMTCAFSEIQISLHTRVGFVVIRANFISFQNIDIPWRAILTSLPVVAICLCHFAWHWVFILMLTNEPLYLNSFGFNLAEVKAFNTCSVIFVLTNSLPFKLLYWNFCHELLIKSYWSIISVNKCYFSILTFR